MTSEIILELDRILPTGNTAGCLDFLIQHARAQNNFTLLFETRLMQKRLELGLPLIQTDVAPPLPPELRAAYDEGIMQAADEAGGLFLQEGNIQRAWPYFRAIAKPAPVIEAIDRYRTSDPNADDVNAVIALAFEEGLHPAKGLQLIFELHGMCRAITSFGMYNVQKDRENCIALLVRGVHAEIVDRMSRAIEAQEGAPPPQHSLPELMANREYLFGQYDCYVDNSHVITLLPYIAEVDGQDTLRLYSELCAYGNKLSPQFKMRGEPPFEDPYTDYGYYVQALRGVETEAALAHFRARLSDAQSAEVLVNLLLRLGRPSDALAISLEYLADEPGTGACPSTTQLCFMAGDFELLKQLAAERGDPLSYVAALSASSAAPAAS